MSERTTRQKGQYLSRLVAEEVSSFAKYFSSVRPVVLSKGTESEIFLQLSLNDNPLNLSSSSVDSQFGETNSDERRLYLVDLVSDPDHFAGPELNDALDEILPRLTRYDRVVVLLPNAWYKVIGNCWRQLFSKHTPPARSFLTRTSLQSICQLSDLQMMAARPVALVPIRLFGIGGLLNRLLPILPLVRNLSLSQILVFKSTAAPIARPSVSIVIPARNECGNIENAILRMPDFNAPIEIIYVEGHSTDGTWEEILRVKELYQGKYSISAYPQKGKGKADAVRLGFAHAKHELLVVLDADLTVPPEVLPQFYDAFLRGYGDFINGNRLVYPMEGDAMKPLNLLGNLGFAKALSFVLDTRLGDTLCGTKVMLKTDYLRMQRWRADFGDVDPFGDFEMLFPAALMHLGIVDLPVKYRSRVYGATNILRFRHGWMLFRMAISGLRKIKLGRQTPSEPLLK